MPKTKTCKTVRDVLSKEIVKTQIDCCHHKRVQAQIGHSVNLRFWPVLTPVPKANPGSGYPSQDDRGSATSIGSKQASDVSNRKEDGIANCCIDSYANADLLQDQKFQVDTKANKCNCARAKLFSRRSEGHRYDGAIWQKGALKNGNWAQSEQRKSTQI